MTHVLVVHVIVVWSFNWTEKSPSAPKYYVSSQFMEETHHQPTVDWTFCGPLISIVHLFVQTFLPNLLQITGSRCQPGLTCTGEQTLQIVSMCDEDRPLGFPPSEAVQEQN